MVGLSRVEDTMEDESLCTVSPERKGAAGKDPQTCWTWVPGRTFHGSDCLQNTVLEVMSNPTAKRTMEREPALSSPASQNGAPPSIPC